MATIASPELKPWQETMTDASRNQYVEIIMKSLFVDKDLSSLHLQSNDYNIDEMITISKCIESEAYGTANTRSEYYHMLAEKIYKVQKETLRGDLIQKQMSQH